MSNKSLLKNDFRDFCKKNLKINKYLFSKQISKEIYKIAKNYKNILLFIPLENEVEINGVIKQLKRDKKNIFVPFMQDLSFKMVKYSLPLKKKKFSIIEPHNKNKALEKIDLAIVPVLGIDSDFRRIGFGKGMYDRFFEKLKYKPKIIFVQIRPCIAKIKVSDEFDIKADEYISYKIRRKNDNRNYSRFFFIRSRGVSYNKENG